jgi:tRNA-specific 2-thiouridylase
MLAALDPALLDRISFPLGGQDKAATRAEAERAGLAAAKRAESQEACFLAGDDYRAFLGRNGLAPRPGAVVDGGGRELGRHDGFWRFTPGQRRGLGLAAPEPLYVLGTDAAGNTVTVGPRERLARRTVATRGRLYADVERVEAKLRYRSDAVPATVSPLDGGFSLELDEPAYGVAPGQTAVLYDGDAVVGCGTIVAAGA